MLFTFAEFTTDFPELEGITEGQFNLWYLIATKMFCAFAGFTDADTIMCLMKLAVAHIGTIICEGGQQIKELKTMNATEKYETQKRSPLDLTLDRTTYGQLIQATINIAYTGGFSSSYREACQCLSSYYGGRQIIA